MSDAKHLIFVLHKDKDALEIQMNKSGLEDLVYYLQRLQKSKCPLPRHDHLATESWAGNELTEEIEGGVGTVLHQVTLRLIG